MDNPSTNQTTTPAPYPETSSTDAPPPPPPNLAPNIPPPEVLQQAQAAPPPPAAPAPPSPSPSIVAPPPAKKTPLKKIFLIFLILGLFLLLVFMILQFLPQLRGGLSFSGQAELTWWGLWEDETIINPIIEDYQKSHPKVKITYVAQSKEDYRERLMNSLAQGKGPDIFRFHNTWVPMFSSALAVLPSDVISASEFESTFYPVAVRDLTTSEGLVGIPLMYEGLGLYINEEIFATYGKKVPATWDALRETAIALTIKNEQGVIKQSGVALGRADNVDHWQDIIALMLLQNHADPLNLSKNAELTEGALSYYASFATTADVWDETLPPSTTYFASGKLAMYFGPSWRTIEIIDQNPSLRFKVVPVPQLPKVNPSDPDIGYASYWAEGVWAESESSEEAWKFLKHLSQKDTLEKLYRLASESDSRREFGEAYSRQDMQSLISSHPILGGIISLAPVAESSYLASRTFDGETGINSRLSAYLADVVNQAATGRVNLTEPINTAAAGFQQVLSSYGLVAAPAPASQ